MNNPSNPTPLTSYQEPGKEAEAVLVWQIKHTKGWGNLRPDEVELYKNSNATTRQAWQPIEQAETQHPSQMKEEQKTVEEAASNYTEGAGVALLGSAQYSAFIAGAQWQKSDTAFIESITEPLKDRIEELEILLEAERKYNNIDSKIESIVRQTLEYVADNYDTEYDLDSITGMHPEIVNQIINP